MSMKALTVRQNAYNETIDWLENDEQGPKPAPPEGMHELAVREWWTGHDEAYAEFNVNEEGWGRIEDFLAFAVKMTILYTGLWYSQSFDDPWIKVFGGLAGLIFLWKFWR